jgi:hypothetical protein
MYCLFQADVPTCEGKKYADVILIMDRTISECGKKKGKNIVEKKRNAPIFGF